MASGNRHRTIAEPAQPDDDTLESLAADLRLLCYLFDIPGTVPFRVVYRLLRESAYVDSEEWR